MISREDFEFLVAHAVATLGHYAQQFTPKGDTVERATEKLDDLLKKSVTDVEREKRTRELAERILLGLFATVEPGHGKIEIEELVETAVAGAVAMEKAFTK